MKGRVESTMHRNRRILNKSSSISSTAIAEEELLPENKMQVDTEPAAAAASVPPPRVPSPMITVTDQDAGASTAPGAATPAAPRQLTPTRERKKSPATGVSPRQRKRSQPVRGELLPDPDKLLSYKHHDKKEEDDMEDPTFPGGHPKPPPEPRAPGQPAERKRSNVTFCPVVQTIEK